MKSRTDSANRPLSSLSSKFIADTGGQELDRMNIFDTTHNSKILNQDLRNIYANAQIRDEEYKKNSIGTTGGAPINNRISKPDNCKDRFNIYF